MSTRRDALMSLLIGGAASIAPRTGEAQAATQCASELSDGSGLRWRRGLEGQRLADLGDGTFLNPIFSGDRPDPAILKDGADYWMTFSSFDAYPGVMIWHSRDLVNWRPIGPALRTPIGSVWACDIAKHRGRYYIYIPARTPQRRRSPHPCSPRKPRVRRR